MMSQPARLLPGMKLTATYKKAYPRQKGMTLIELIIAIVLLAIVILPTAKLFQQSVETMNYTSGKAMANNLLRNEISIINNLLFTDITLADSYDNTTANYEGYGYSLRRQVNIVAGTGNAIKRVIVTVSNSSTLAVVAQAATYVAQNVSFGAASGGTAPSSGDAQYLVVSGGSISTSSLRNVTLRNSANYGITITGVTVTFTGQSNIRFSSVIMNGVTRWDGSLTSPATVDFTADGKPDFTLTALTTYTNTARFNFSRNLSTISVIFIMSDGSQTPAYNWP